MLIIQKKNAQYNKKNLYLISSWYNNIFDKELLILKNKLIDISTCGKFNDDITKGLLEEEQKKDEQKKIKYIFFINLYIVKNYIYWIIKYKIGIFRI